MSLKVITTTNNKEGAYKLEASLKKYGYDYEIIEHPWYGFLSKIHETYNYVKKLEGYTHFLYTDAWDTLAFGMIDVELKDEILISTERACYPHPELASQYPEVSTPWKYVNGGGWLCSIKRFIEIYEMNKPTDELNDQVWLTKVFLKHKDTFPIHLDYNCDIFQTIAFCPESDFDVTLFYVKNNITGSFPKFIHGNGHTPMTRFYDIN